MSAAKPLFWSALAFVAFPILPLSGQSLEQKVQDLEEKLKRMEARLAEIEAQRAPATSQPQPIAGASLAVATAVPDIAVATAGREGFWIRSTGGDFKLNLAGYVQSDGRFYLDNSNNLGTNTFLLRRVRPILQGTIRRNIDFRLIPDFGGGAAVIQDAYVEFKYFPKATLRAGKFKTPVGLEQLQADQDLTFVERALPTNLVPNRDVGVQLSGDLAEARLNYAAGVFNGVPDGANGDGDTNNRKDVAARLFATPFRLFPLNHPLTGLGFGIAATIGRQDGALPALKTPGQVNFFSYATNVVAGGSRTRFSPQAYYYHGPLGLMFEYVRSEQRVKKGTNTPVVSNNAVHLAASYLLTGERKSFRSATPLQEFDPLRGGWGAWELVARFERLSVDRASYSLGLADATKSARRAQAWTGGVNWILNRNVRFALNYSRSTFEGGAAAGDRSPENALLSRFQIAF